MNSEGDNIHSVEDIYAIHLVAQIYLRTIWIFFFFLKK